MTRQQFYVTLEFDSAHYAITPLELRGVIQENLPMASEVTVSDATKSELHEALEPLEPLLEFMLLAVKMPPDRTEAFRQAHAKARAALAKARGEQNVPHCH